VNGGGAVDEEASWKIVNAFYDALRLRDIEVIGECLHDDVDWMIMGPVDILPYCGQRYGKKAVLQVFRDIAELVTISDIVREFLCVDPDKRPCSAA
jgi:ketosteroid isomerase-like protein